MDTYIYHAITRGNNRATVFRSDDDFRIYDSFVRKSREKHDFRLFHYNYMPNHVHLELSVADPERLAAFMKSLNQRYAWTYKLKYDSVGHVWQNRYRRFLITNDTYLTTCGIYIELNPVRAGIVQAPEDYQWSSYRTYAFGESDDLITLDPAYLGLGQTPEMRQQAYRDLTDMWRRHPVSKKGVKNFFRQCAQGKKIGWHPKNCLTLFRKR